jgi:hypothetical protein
MAMPSAAWDGRGRDGGPCHIRQQLDKAGADVCSSTTCACLSPGWPCGGQEEAGYSACSPPPSTPDLTSRHTAVTAHCNLPPSGTRPAACSQTGLHKAAYAGLHNGQATEKGQVLGVHAAQRAQHVLGWSALCIAETAHMVQLHALRAPA